MSGPRPACLMPLGGDWLRKRVLLRFGRSAGFTGALSRPQLLLAFALWGQRGAARR